MVSQNSKPGESTLADLLKLIGEIFYNMGEDLENITDKKGAKHKPEIILYAVQDAVEKSQKLSELPNELQTAFRNKEILVDKQINEIKALAEYATLLADVEKENTDWQADGEFLKKK